MAFRCHMCNFTSINSADIVRHAVKKHRNDPSFNVACNIAGCGATYRVWTSLKTHMHRKHQMPIAEPDVGLEAIHEDMGKKNMHAYLQNLHACIITLTHKGTFT